MIVLSQQCSKEDMTSRLLKSEDDLTSIVEVANPKTLDFQVARNTLMSGLLKTINANKKMPLPIKIFEVSDVVIKDAKTGM